MEFKTIEELTEFILGKCCRMDYTLENSGSRDRIKLLIKGNFNMKYIYILDTQMEELFDRHINEIYIEDDISEIEEGYLDKMKIHTLLIFFPINKLPILPDTLTKICNNNGGWSHIRKDKDGWYVQTHIDNALPRMVQGNSKRELLDKISSLEIEV